MIFGNELTFELPQESAIQLLERNKIAGLQADKVVERKFVDTYFDSPRYRYFRAGITLFVRKEGWIHTQKARQQQAGARPKEWTTRLDAPAPAIVMSRELRSELGLSAKTAAPTRRIFSATLEQKILTFRTKSATFTLTVNVGMIRVAGHAFKYVAEPIFSAEIAQKDGSELDLFEFALRLAGRHELMLRSCPMEHRGFALASRSLRQPHVKATKVQLSETLSAGESFRLIVENTLHHLMHNQTAALRGDPNGIHQTRVAMRRLRAALRAFKKVLPYEGRKAFNGELRWFQQRTGPARDWHVFIDETLPKLKPADVDPEQLQILRRLARRIGLAHAHEAAELLRSRRFTRLLLQFGRWVAEMFEEGEPSKLDEPIVPFARRTMAKTHRDLLSEAAGARPGLMEDMHKVRIRGKKARYAGEFFSALFDDEQAKPYLQAVERLQDRLGTANDARVARTLMAEFKHGDLRTETVDGVHAWSSRRVARCLDQATPVLDDLRTVPRFWRP